MFQNRDLAPLLENISLFIAARKHDNIEIFCLQMADEHKC